MAVLPNLAQELEAAKRIIAEQQAAIAALAKSKSGGISFKVSEKKALSIYGLGRLPLTLYISQWDRLVENIEAVHAFVTEHRAEFATKE